MAEKKNPKKGILLSSAYAGICGMGLDIIAPMFMEDVTDNGIAKVMKVVGILGATYYAMTWSKFDRLFINMDLGIDNVYPIQKNVKKGDKSTYYKFTLPTGMSVSEIEKKRENIEQHFGKKVEISFLNHGLFGIEMFHNTTAEMYDYDEDIKVDGDLAFPVGYDLYGKLVTCNLRCDDNCHMLIGSTSGGGKSVFLRCIITYLITHKIVELYLIDLKGTEFPIFEKCSCVKGCCYEPNEVLVFLQEITRIMKHRYQIFRNNGVRDIEAYNQKRKKTPMNHIAVIIDEFSELMEDDDSQRELERLSALSRASGLHLLISTQRPDSHVISSRIKCNVNVIAGMKTNTDINSRIIIDDDRLSDLRGHGHMIFRYGGKDVELQDMFISDNQIERLIKPFEVVKPKVVEQPIVKDDVIDVDYMDLGVFTE